MPILPSHKTNIEYVEHCRVVAADDRLSFVRKRDALEQHFAIPYGNTAVLMLGPGTSITQQAARLAASQGMLVCFAAGGGTPIYLGALNEYREPEYLQRWYPLWADPARRLASAKAFQRIRVDCVVTQWKRIEESRCSPERATRTFLGAVDRAADTAELMAAEAGFAKALYAVLAESFGNLFARQPRAGDQTNRLLDHGNYLAYGLAAGALWILGIPHSLPLLHGKTRRGALVFDVADLVKDACIMPNAFVSAAEREDDMTFRRRCLASLDEIKALRLMCQAIIEQVPSSEGSAAVADCSGGASGTC